MEPDSNISDNTENLGLEPEANQLMAKPVERTDLTDDEKLSQYFGRALSDGQQQGPTPGANYTEPENQGEQAVDDTPIASEEQQQEEQQELQTEQQAQPKGVDKRIGKLTAQKKEAEERAKKLEEELESLKRQQASPRPVNPTNPFGKLDDESKIQAEYERQKEIRLFCERYPDGYYEDGKEPITKEQIARAKVNAIRAIEDHLPNQYDYVSKAKAFDAAAKKEFPWLNNPADNRTIAARKFVEAVPELTRFPDYKIYAAHLANGMVSYQQQKSAARNGQAAPRPPVQPISNGFSPPPTGQKPNEQAAKEAASRYTRTSSLNDLSDVFKNKFV